MPAARGVKRTASKSSTATASSTPKNKKKRGIQLDIPSAPKKRGCLLTCGQGDVGQLGLGEDVVETSKFKQVAALGEKIIAVCAGGMHTLALDKDGKVWSFGCNDEGALGRAASGEGEEGSPAIVPLQKKVVAIAAGDSHSAALLDNGDVYAWGSFRDSHGSMGLVYRGREGKSCREPVRIDIGESAVAIASGGDHLVILSISGAVFTMGCGEQGQLGRLSQRSASRDARQGFSSLLVPSKVTLKGGASRVWAGYHATFALDANGEKIFAWGLNNYGQLGITGEKRKIALYSPMECDAFTHLNVTWTSVACGQHHSLALDSSGQVYSIGRCEYGRLGLGDRTTDAVALEPVTSLQNKKCICISAGTSNSFAVTDSGEVLSWGMGSEGQLGSGACSDATSPRPAPPPASLGARRALAVAAGGQHTVVLLEDDKEASPEPEANSADQEVDEPMEEDEQEEEEKVEQIKQTKRPNKRQKKHDQEDEVSSTSSAPPKVDAEDKPQKLNGDKKKATPMDVDACDGDGHTDKDKSQETDEQKQDIDQKPDMKETTKPETSDTSSQETTETEIKSLETDIKLSVQPEQPETEKSETKTEESDKKQEESDKKQEESEKKTEDTGDKNKEEPKVGENKSEEMADKLNDVEMSVEKPVNGTDDPPAPVVEAKSIETIQSNNELTNTA